MTYLILVQLSLSITASSTSHTWPKLHARERQVRFATGAYTRVHESKQVGLRPVLEHARDTLIKTPHHTQPSNIPTNRNCTFLHISQSATPL